MFSEKEMGIVIVGGTVVLGLAYMLLISIGRAVLL